MPTYEYACTGCGRRFDVFLRLDEAPRTRCEECGGVLRKVFHPAGIVFKGPGFYATDARRTKAPAGEDRSKDRSKDTGGSSDDAGTSTKPSKGSSSSKGSGDGSSTPKERSA